MFRIFADLNEIFYTSVFRIKIYGRDNNPRRRKILYVEFKENKKGLKPHLMNKLDKNYLINFFEDFNENNNEIFFKGKLIKNSFIRNKKVEFNFKEIDIKLEKFIYFLKSEHFKTHCEDTNTLIEFIQEEYEKEWKSIEKPKILIPDKKLVKKIKEPEKIIEKPKPPSPKVAKNYESEIKSLKHVIQQKDNLIEKLQNKIQKHDKIIKTKDIQIKEYFAYKDESLKQKKNINRLVSLVNNKENIINNQKNMIEKLKQELKELEESIEEVEYEET